MTRLVRPAACWLGATALVIAIPLAACGSEKKTTGKESAVERSAEQTPEQKVQEEIDKKRAERRKAMLAEAHAALDETNTALKALEEGKNKQALEALARATGKLELIVARDPELSLAPVDVAYITHDIYGKPEAIRKARDEAEKLLEDGKVQDARALLSGLASEFIIQVRSLPLATYPEAIKKVSPLIDDGKIEEAKTALRAALNTLVVTNHVHSLPVMRAQQMLDQAQELVKEGEPSEEDRKKIDDLVDGAREQLEMAELLGYGEEEEHEKFRKQIAELEGKIGADEETKGVFAKLRNSLDGFQSSFFD